MRFEWDAAKNDENLAKHGLAFDRAAEVFAGAMCATLDERRDYGETRWVGYGMLSARVVVVAWTMRGADTIRIISMRRGNARERKIFEGRPKG